MYQGHYDDYQWARKELKALLSTGAFDVTKIGSGKNVGRADTLSGEVKGWDLRTSTMAYANALQAVIRGHRTSARYVEEYSPVKVARREVEAIVSGTLRDISARGWKSVLVRCVPKPSIDNPARLEVGVCWKRKVFDQGIAVPWYHNTPMLTLRAERKASAHLAMDGIELFEATVYAPRMTGQAHAGYIFKASGRNDLVFFHTGFSSGASMTKRRINNAVMERLLASA
jgi:hypothetical protein